MASSTLLSQDISSVSEREGDEQTGCRSIPATSITSTLYNEAGVVRDGLQGLSFEPVKDTYSAPEGIVASGSEQGSVLVSVVNVLHSNPAELSRRANVDVGVDHVTPQQKYCHGRAGQQGGCSQIPRGLMHEYRPPPALQLPDQTVMDSEFTALHRANGSDYALPNFRLPATLVSSPSCHTSCQDVKASLDPNAKEYTPGPSPCISPGVSASPLQHHVGVPSSYSFESGHIFLSGLDNCSMMYSPSYGPDSRMSVYGNGSQLAYGLGSITSPAFWGSMEASDMGGHPVPHSAGVHLPLTPVRVAQPLLSSLPMQAFGIAPFQSMGLPSMGVSAQTVIVHPPIRGREHVSRAILLNGVPASMTDEQLKNEMGKWGDVRTVMSDQKHQGLVTVNYFDLRCAKEALRDIQQQHLIKQQRMQQQFQLSLKQRGPTCSSNCSNNSWEHIHSEQVVKHPDLISESVGASATVSTSGRGLVNGVVMWAQYTLPIGVAVSSDGMNQGTLVVFNLDVDTSIEHLKSVFEVYGDVKELRETPAKKQHKFVEFYDVRDASKALKALDGSDINGKRVKIEFSRPGGQAYKACVQLQQQAHVTTAYRPCTSDSRPPFVGSGPEAAAGQPFYMNWNGNAAVAPLAVPIPHGGGSFLWASNFEAQVPPLGLPVPQPWNNGDSRLQSYNVTSVQAGSASTGGPLVVMGSVKAISYGRSGSRNMAIPYSGGSVSSRGRYSSALGYGRGSSSGSAQCRGDGSSNRKKRNSLVGGTAGHTVVDTVTLLGPGNKLREGSLVGTRISSSRLVPRMDVPPQYVFDEAGVAANLAQRTTLMIKNIPNKYSQQMLLSLLDDHCLDWNKRSEEISDFESAYDFVYLPIDFKCNLGYAFVNFTSVQATMRLYKDFHLQQWEEFNSRKICHVTYARVQGRIALEEHFKNSRFACDTDDYLPLVFCPPRNGSNSSIPATIAAIHHSGRVVGISSLEEHGKGSRCVEKSEVDYSKRVHVNCLMCTSQELEIGLSKTGQSKGPPLAGHKSIIP